jgi:hypothetical protein
MNFKAAALTVLITSVVAGLVSYFSGLEYWPVFVIALVAFLVNGFVATVEDDLPGGFNNPDGTEAPAYMSTVAWIVRGIGLVALAIIVFIMVLWSLG